MRPQRLQSSKEARPALLARLPGMDSHGHLHCLSLCMVRITVLDSAARKLPGAILPHTLLRLRPVDDEDHPPPLDPAQIPDRYVRNGSARRRCRAGLVPSLRLRPHPSAVREMVPLRLLRVCHGALLHMGIPSHQPYLRLSRHQLLDHQKEPREDNRRQGEEVEIRWSAEKKTKTKENRFGIQVP